MASNAVWYAGQCVKRTDHEKVAHLEAVAQLVNGEWELIDNPEVLFRHMNDVELRAAEGRQMKVSDWAAFTIGNKEHRAKSWPVIAHRRLYHYLDLAAVGDAEQVQRRLVVEGIQTQQPSGIWIVRCADDEVLQIELRQAGGVAHLAAGSGNVPAYRFDPAAVTLMPMPKGEVQLYDLKGAIPATVYDWAPDDAFALRVVRTAADAGDPHARNLVAWLESHTKQAKGLLPLKSSDLAAANEALRTGKLAKRLAADQALLRTFVDALIADERIGALFKECAERVAEQERTGARTRAEAQAKREIDATRKQRLAVLAAELDKAAQAQQAQLDIEHAQRMKALHDEMDKLRADGEAEIQVTIGERAQAIGKVADELNARCEALRLKAAEMAGAVEEERQKLELLHAEAAEAKASMEAIRAESTAATAELAHERACLAATRMKCPLPTTWKTTKTLTLERIGIEIEASRLLTANGKALMTYFLALTLAGEVPALCGPEVEDFLLAAEIMFGGGRSVRMEGDPTVITFEDLWVRAGTDLRTGLGHALATASGAEGVPRTTLAVVRRAERSGARFWYPALADHALRGDLPRRLLLCVTIADHDCEEAGEILAHAVKLDVSGALASSAAVSLAMAASTGTATELDPGLTRGDIAVAAAEVTDNATLLGAARGARAMRAAAELARLSPSAKLPAIVQLFLDVGAHDAGANKPWSKSHA